MTASLPPSEAERWINRLRQSAAKTECWSCECLQALLTQVERDCPEVAATVGPMKVASKGMHHCLGCEPCPPADVFAEYLRR